MNQSILPNIEEVAKEHGIELGKMVKGQYKVICPFPSHGEKTPSMFINPQKNVFKCFGCGEGGGVIKFISLLENKSEQEVLKSLTKDIERSPKGKKKFVIFSHPAEKLTTYQLRLIGFHNKPSWESMRQHDYFYYRRTLDFVFEEWQEFIETEKEKAQFYLKLGKQVRAIYGAVDLILAREKEIGVQLLPRKEKTKNMFKPHEQNKVVVAQ
ncbi:MAG: CHC2 zinc finger domain-containing protein [Tepidibacillus sp.]